MQGPRWRDWVWSFGKALYFYDTKRIYRLLCKKLHLAPTLNPRWPLMDPEKR